MYAHSHIHVNSLPRILIHFFFFNANTAASHYHRERPLERDHLHPHQAPSISFVCGKVSSCEVLVKRWNCQSLSESVARAPVHEWHLRQQFASRDCPAAVTSCDIARTLRPPLVLHNPKSANECRAGMSRGQECRPGVPVCIFSFTSNY